MLSQGDIVVRPAVAADASTLSAWLSDDRVAARYGGRDRVAEEIASITGFEREDELRRCIVELGGRPVGYLQYYPVDDAASYGLEDATGVWATDQFIGIPELWGQGIGPRFVRLVASHLMASGARRVVTDPAVANKRAIRAYEKAGFVALAEIPRHEMHEGEWLDCVLMEFRG